MSIYEASITNPKKQLEFYKDLSEQLQRENKILRENAKHNDKVVDKVNWENMLLKKENKQLKDNWNELREVIRKKQDYYRYVKDNRYRKFLSELLDKMQEIEGNDSDE